MNLKKSIESHILLIIERLQKAGFETYLVGGAVRDIMLGRPPKDYDISTSASPEEVQAVFGRRYARIIGKRFRIVHVYHGAEIIEVSTFRKAPKVQEDDKILPFDNEFGSAVEDAWRRDFTVNAIFYDPGKDEILDYTGTGISDLEAGIVRIVGEPAERFEEDPVRLLRALKLVGQYGFTIEENTEQALYSALPLITCCSISRLTLELDKIIGKPYASGILQAFHKFGLLAYYLPFLNESWGSEECAYMLELTEERNRRLKQGLYRNSISLAIAAMALPFVEKELAGEHSATDWRGWKYYYGIEKDIRKIVGMVFTPYHFPKRIIGSAVGMIMLQPSMLNKARKDNVLLNRRYKHARELMTLQNNLRFNDDSLEEFWPTHGKRGGKKNKPPARRESGIKRK